MIGKERKRHFSNSCKFKEKIFNSLILDNKLNLTTYLFFLFFKIMTKTVETQIEESLNLIKGLRRHLSEGGGGTTLQELSAMEQTVTELMAASDECDRLRAELAPKVQYLNKVLDKVRDEYVVRKLIVRNNYPKERWADYGLQDKR